MHEFIVDKLLMLEAIAQVCLFNSTNRTNSTWPLPYQRMPVMTTACSHGLTFDLMYMWTALQCTVFLYTVLLCTVLHALNEILNRQPTPTRVHTTRHAAAVPSPASTPAPNGRVFKDFSCKPSAYIEYYMIHVYTNRFSIARECCVNLQTSPDQRALK